MDPIPQGPVLSPLGIILYPFLNFYILLKHKNPYIDSCPVAFHIGLVRPG
jgi:hypothetical protein